MTEAEIKRLRAEGADIDDGEARWYMLTPAEQEAECFAAEIRLHHEHLTRERVGSFEDNKGTAASSGATSIGPIFDEPTWVTEYNAAYTWQELLGGDGWQLHHTDRDGTRHWVRPGKTPSKGSAATTGHKGIDKLHVFTTFLDWLPADDSYSRWAYMVHRDFGGDFRAASRAIRAVRG